jgi:hypothetical protein
LPQTVATHFDRSRAGMYIFKRSRIGERFSPTVCRRLRSEAIHGILGIKT